MNRIEDIILRLYEREQEMDDEGRYGDAKLLLDARATVVQLRDKLNTIRQETQVLEE